jgi:hypothetical protein
MDSFTLILASTAVAALIPYIKKGAEEFAGELGKAAAEKVKGLLGALKRRLSGDKEAAPVLENFEQKPDRYNSALTDILKEKLDQDQGFVQELERTLREIKEASPVLNVYLKMAEGKRVTGAEIDEILKGNVKVDMDIQKGEDVTGAKVKRIG